MKAVILAGGFGTRLSEETDLRPKPMVLIGGKPILWHIMKHYERHGITEFVICLGYMSDYIKKFFLDYASTSTDFTIDLHSQKINVHTQAVEKWKVTLLDTGLHTKTGGRIKRAIQFLNDDSPFCLTYGDGVSNVDIKASIDFHRSHGKSCTVTAITPPGRFGVLDVNDNDEVMGFREKIASDQYRINGGFFVLNPSVADYISGDNSSWEEEPLKALCEINQVSAWVHDGFWQAMDTLRDKETLNKLWDNGNPPWTI